MANTSAIKSRIKSVKNTKQITKAMELVAASKMRKCQEATLASRAYRNTAREILTRINKEIDVSDQPLFKQRPVKSKLYLLVTSDRGLAGAYTTNILKEFVGNVKDDQAAGTTVKVMVIGKLGARFVAKLDDIEVVAVYEKFPETPSSDDVRPILINIFNQYGVNLDGSLLNNLKNVVDQVEVVFTDFISTINQQPTSQTVLPAVFAPAESPHELVGVKGEIPFEPSPEAVVAKLTPKLVEVQVYQAILEAQASEQVARMMAMKNASDNAGDIIDALTLEYNSARQASITQELAEITAGAEAIS